MRRLTASLIESALRESCVWNVSNEVLYNLCADHPDHVKDEVIIAKFWLIGRTYSAAVERRRVKDKYPGDLFYTKNLAPKVRSSGIDSWFKGLKRDEDSLEAVYVHKRLTDFLYDLTKLNKRSLASKYLHFHFPERFFLYDTRASNSIKQLVSTQREHPVFRGNVDTSYARFFCHCQRLSQQIRSEFGKSLSPRELDHVLLYWDRTRKMT